ncbi:GNAT family N-acetyltransferase [Phenylobacterium terrae]|uniref:GNAT family N-acetyltransferase n=1 Tax=Phenylobacterium terrae TaxID=2665495 RepID=A0ABW4MZK4_9CAUL
MSCLALSPHVESPRLRLRGVRPGDLPRLAELANDYDVVKMTGSMPYPYTAADAEAFYEKACAGDPADHATFVLEHEDAPIGVLSFTPGPFARTEIGYWLGRPFWGRGLATEAVRAALGWARGDWRKKLVLACHYADNPASGQVLIKSGFLYTGDVEPKVSKARGEAAPVRWMVWLA